MSTKDIAYWREKYRNLLREQEQRSINANPDLQVAIEKLAQTAALLDRNLASGLSAVSQQAKRRQWGKPGQLALLEQAIESYQRQVLITREREAQAIKQVSQSLTALPLDDGSKKAVKQLNALYKKQSFANEWAPLWEAISALTARASATQPAGDSPGLLARLFSHTDTRQKQELEPVQEPEPVQAQGSVPRGHLDAPVGEPQAARPDSFSECEREVEAATVERLSPREDIADLLGISGQLLVRSELGPLAIHEPAFSKISDRISMVLGDLLTQIEPHEAVVEKAIAAKLRIDKGLNWYELVPTLEDIRDLVMALMINAKQDYQKYLLHLLEKINQLITMTGSAATALVARENQLVIDLGVEVSALEDAGRSVSDVDGLKSVIELRVQALASVLSRHKASAAGQDSVEQQVEQLQSTIQQLKNEAVEKQTELEAQRTKARTDSLTGLANREAYNERLFHEIERFRRYERDLTLIVCDIDHFKAFNDNYSHQVGDRVLKVLSNAIQKQLRDVDFIARYGGEEFVVLMPETRGAEALIKMDKIRTAVAATTFKFKEHQLNITFSAGIAQARDGDTSSSLFARADKLLYEAKHRGRNCCVLESD